jgi:rod shape-determining protein MreD
MTRPLLFLAAGYALLLVQATLRQVIPVVALVPDLALVLVAYLGLTPRQSAPVGAGVALLVGYLADLLCGAPRGLFALVYVLAFLAARVAQLRLLTRGRVFEVWFSFLLAFAVGIAVVVVRAVGGGAVRGFAVAALQAAATAVVAPVVCSLGRRIDRWSSRVPEGPDRGTLKVELR